MSATATSRDVTHSGMASILAVKVCISILFHIQTKNKLPMNEIKSTHSVTLLRESFYTMRYRTPSVSAVTDT